MSDPYLSEGVSGTVPSGQQTIATTTGGKYFQIYVPNYDGSAQLDSYLRMGKPFAASTDEYGVSAKTLWEKFTGFHDQKTAATDEPFRDRSTAGLRDWTATTSTDGVARTNATSVFYSNVGWRDHTDGNRLSTTGGDKVEVIKGNYQLIVLGRGSSVSNDAAVVDISGGIYWSGDIAPGSVTKVEYKSSKFAGTWKVTEVVDKGHVHEIFQGEFKEEFRGSKKTSIVGTVPSSVTSEFTTEGTRGATDDPDLLDGTWANTIKEYTGTSDKRITSITSATWAGTISETTDASTSITETVKAPTISTTTKASTSITENVGEDSNKVPNIYENIYADNITTTIKAGKIKEEVGTASSNTHLEAWHWGFKEEFLFGAGMEVNFAGFFKFTLANTVDIILGSHREVHAGGFAEICMGYKQDVVLGWEMEVTIPESNAVSATKKNVALAIFLG